MSCAVSPNDGALCRAGWWNGPDDVELPGSFLPTEDQGEIMVQYTCRPGRPLPVQQK